MLNHTPRYGIKYRFKGCTLRFSLSEIDGDTAYFVTRQGEESRVVNRANWHTLRPMPSYRVANNSSPNGKTIYFLIDDTQAVPTEYQAIGGYYFVNDKLRTFRTEETAQKMADKLNRG